VAISLATWPAARRLASPLLSVAPCVGLGGAAELTWVRWSLLLVSALGLFVVVTDLSTFEDHSSSPRSGTHLGPSSGCAWSARRAGGLDAANLPVGE
jgi:hypothetical protein